MKQNGIKSGSAAAGNVSRLMALEQLIREREDEILNDPLAADDLSDEEGQLDEESTNLNESKMIATQPSGKCEDEDFATDSSEDNASVVSEESDCEDPNPSSTKKANELKAQGDEHVHAGKWTEAIKCYSEALKYSELAVLYGNRAHCYTKTGEFDKAERDCSCAIELDPTYKRIFRRRAAIRLRRRDYYGSAKDLQDLRILSATSATDPNVLEEYKVILPLARYMAVHGDCSADQKFKDLEKVVLEKLCEAEEAAAKSFSSRKMWAQAVESLSMAIMASPCLPRLYCERALANFKLGKVSLAEKDCTEAIDLDPSNPKYLQLRAEIRKKLGDLTGSEADEKAAKKLLPAGRESLSPLRLEKTEPRAEKTKLQHEKTESPTVVQQTRTTAQESTILFRIPVQDVYSSSIDELYNLSKLPDKIRSLFSLS